MVSTSYFILSSFYLLTICANFPFILVPWNEILTPFPKSWSNIYSSGWDTVATTIVDPESDTPGRGRFLCSPFLGRRWRRIRCSDPTSVEISHDYAPTDFDLSYDHHASRDASVVSHSPPTNTSTPTLAICHETMSQIGISNETSCSFMRPPLLLTSSRFSVKSSPIFPEARIGPSPIPARLRTRRRRLRGFRRIIVGGSFRIRSGARSWSGFQFWFRSAILVLLLILILLLLSLATNQWSHRLQGWRVVVGTGTSGQGWGQG